MRRKSLHLKFMSVLIVLVLAGYSGLAWAEGGSPTVSPTQTLSTLNYSSTAAPLAWPGYGQAAVGAEGYGLLAINNAQVSVPAASTAKIMAAYAVLKTKPLTLGETSTPLLTLTQTDVDIYNDFVAKDGSVAAVSNGEKLSEYQALQALMLPSANNMADSLAIWAFGSTTNYLAYANDLANQMGMTDTHFDDTSGFSPQTVSTAQDMVRLALAAMKDPVFAEIVGQSTATIPVAGTVHNVNGLLGRDNIIGVKTGNTDEAGGCFVAAATHVVDGKTITVITAIMAAPNLVRSMLDSLPLLASAKANFASDTILPAGTVVGYYRPAWSKSQVAVKTAGDTKLLIWKGSKPRIEVGIKTISAPMAANSKVGTVYVHATGTNVSSPVITSDGVPAPGLSWRLRHPF